jgi:hypothetical protein
MAGEDNRYEDNGGSFLLVDSFNAARSRWPVIAAVIAAGAIIGGALALGFPKYEAKGFYYTPGWTLADYKRFRSEFGDADVISAYLRDHEHQQAAALLVARAANPRFWDTAAKPLFPLTKKDAKEVFEGAKERDGATILGLEISLGGRSIDHARQAVVMLGNYVTKVLLLTALQNWIATTQAAGNGELLKAENQVLQTRYSIDQSKQRIGDLRSLQDKYPEAQRMELRQVVSADPASARYLAPIAQVVALEAGVAESNESLRRMERRARQLKLETAFFDAAANEAKKAQQGWVLLKNLISIKKQIFEPLDLSDDAVKEVSNRLDLDIKTFSDQYSIGFGFRSEVLSPSKTQRSATRFAASGAALGFLLALMVVLAPVLWRNLVEQAAQPRVADEADQFDSTLRLAEEAGTAGARSRASIPVKQAA